jgi:hypothetical protein
VFVGMFDTESIYRCIRPVRGKWQNTIRSQVGIWIQQLSQR